MSKRVTVWVIGAAVAIAVGWVVYWLVAGRISDSYSNDVGNVMVSADGRTVYASAPGQQMGACEDNSSSNLETSESARTVQIRVHTRTVKGFVSVCAPGTAAMPSALSVKLSSPLWGRTLVDGDGKPLAYFDGRTVLTPHPMPAGFKLTELYPGTWFGQAARSTAPVATQIYYDVSLGGQLIITQQVGTVLQLPPGATATHIVVQGHAAYLYGNQNEYVTIEWVQGGQTVRLMYPTFRAPGQSGRDAAVAIAQSLR